MKRVALSGFYNSEALVEFVDVGMIVLSELNDTVNNVIQSHNAQSKTGAEVNVHKVLSTPVLSENVTTGQPDAVTERVYMCRFKPIIGQI